MHAQLQVQITCLKRPLKRRAILFLDQSSLNTGQKYCRMLQESILQYFRPSLSYHLSLRSLFCLFLSGRLKQVLLYLGGLDGCLFHFKLSCMRAWCALARLGGCICSSGPSMLAYAKSTNISCADPHSSQCVSFNKHNIETLLQKAFYS